MLTNEELGNMDKALKVIGEARITKNQNILSGLREVLLENGYDAAIVYTEQVYQATDVNAALTRVLVICRRYGLSPEAAVQVIDRLARVDSGVR
ncbi:MAG TPA: hypothetical protein VN455_03370 [Methanotrichaceae archaeon]|nr:hypothetical protein [Methanotrichaceae archaeon]